ncbi:MAG TPA: 3-deoxy-D-manno-octulosonic acid transferase [Gammaproteobacteria bacterium]|nr:3-deoxy-D-manno-octulosonic acid transferase [Gammaproteobacteria bacterium]
MRVIYTLTTAMIAPFAFGWLAIRSRRQTGAPDAARERRGHLPDKPGPSPIWIHAASLGEARAAQPLIDVLIADHPLLITTFTATARRHCRERYAGRATVTMLPYDLPPFVNRFLRAARPCMAIFIETEIWPNLYRALSRRQTPIVIVSARISTRAFERYRRFQSLVTPCLKETSKIAAQTQADADRFIALGAPAERVSVIGNLKFDTRPPPDAASRGAALRAASFGGRPVWVAGSTREGEEEIVLKAFEAVRARVPDCVLVLAPRHPERAPLVAALAAATGCKSVLRSALKDTECDAPILIIDAVGELVDFYAAADVVFVGGTFANVGGHNVLEPAMLGRPLVTGPHLENWRGVAEDMRSDGGLAVVGNVAELAKTVSRLLADANARTDAGAAARASVERHRGATARALRLIGDQLQ